jgi:glycosyltransferase involved in cell wall biosynthesis
VGNSAFQTLQLGMEWQPESPGGLNRYYYDLVRYLPTVGVEVSGLVAGSATVQQMSGGTVQAFAEPRSSLWQRWQSLRSMVRHRLTTQNCPLVVSHFALYVFPVLNQLRDRPLVTHFHGPWALESGAEGTRSIKIWLQKQLEQSCYRPSAKFIVLSTAFRDMLSQKYRIPRDRIHVVPGGIELAQFDISLSQAEARSQLHWPCDRPILFVVRRLVRRMGLENLITAIQSVRQTHPDVLLLIGGKGPLAPNLEDQIRELQLSDYVRLLGYISETDLPIAYRAANFSVVPSIDLEGFGLIVTESLAAGTPVLGTPIGGIPEILQPFSSDLLLEGYTSSYLAQGIIEALSGQRHLPSSEACKTYARQHYDWSVIARQIKAVYQTALDSKTT